MLLEHLVTYIKLDRRDCVFPLSFVWLSTVPRNKSTIFNIVHRTECDLVFSFLHLFAVTTFKKVGLRPVSNVLSSLLPQSLCIAVSSRPGLCLTHRLLLQKHSSSPSPTTLVFPLRSLANLTLPFHSRSQLSYCCYISGTLHTTQVHDLRGINT